MRVLIGGVWQDGFLDEHRDPASCRIEVRCWLRLKTLDDMYFVSAARDWRRVSNYVREIGVREVWRKVRSRLAEQGRNEKVLAVGAGIVRDAGESGLTAGAPVLFLAPAHPPAVERVVLAPVLAAPVSDATWIRLIGDAAGHVWHADGPDLMERLGDPCVEGWHPQSGVPLDASGVRAWLQRLDADGARAGERRWASLPVVSASPTAERRAAAGPPLADGLRRAALFGYGHYAKTIIVPNLDPRLRLEAIHEIDPTQLGAGAGAKVTADTAPAPRPDERYDVYFIAGYHHTHAPLAVHALSHGASAVVEKPHATTRAQLDALRGAMGGSQGRLYVCFHKRYSVLTEQALTDLELARGEPVSYHSVVFEVPLPRLHWYRWPASRTRIVSNGCHWIDHFLYLNDFAPVSRFDAWRARNGDAFCMVELDNGAAFSMALTDTGSPRTGVQNHVELRARDRTVRIVDDSTYVAETARRVLRRQRVNRMHAFARMYKAISGAIASGREIDTARTVLPSAQLTLDLDERYASQGGEPA